MKNNASGGLVKIIEANGNFPNNSLLPVVFYKNALKQPTTQKTMDLFEQNGWDKSWADKIYAFHHYHSNTHEVLAIISGKCEVELGGPNGFVLLMERGDVLVLPAGIS